MIKLALTLFATKDVAGMREFYRRVLQVEPRDHGPASCQFATSGGHLFLEDPAGINKNAPGALRAEPNPGVLLDFEVEDVRAHYQRLSQMGVQFVEPLRVNDQGAGLFRFRDPDGNLLCFFSDPGPARG